MAQTADPEKDVPKSEISYRLPPGGVGSMFIVGYAMFADVVNAFPFLGLLTTPILYIVFMIFGVFPFWMRKNVGLLKRYEKTLSPKAYKKLEEKIQELEKRDARSKGAFHRLLAGAWGGVFVFILDSMPIISWYWWTTAYARAIIKKSQGIDKYKARVVYFAEKYRSEDKKETAAAQQKTEAELLENIATQQQLLGEYEQAKRNKEETYLGNIANFTPEQLEKMQNYLSQNTWAQVGQTRQFANRAESDEYLRKGGAFSKDIPSHSIVDFNNHKEAYNPNDYTESLRSAITTNEDRQARRQIEDLALHTAENTVEPPVSDQSGRRRIAQDALRRAKLPSALSAGDYAHIVAGSAVNNPQGKSDFLRQLREDQRTGVLPHEEFTKMVNAYSGFTPEDKQALFKETAERFSAANIAHRYSSDTDQLRTAITNALQKVTSQKRAQSIQLPPATINIAIDLTLKRIQEAPLNWEPIDDRAINDAVEQVLEIMKNEGMKGNVRAELQS